ncbi:hypothetical protein [Acidisphaera sp. S103]|uniref:hypothetical protein n=1 Tax=Acidisphaera sp. S103 TaxID=1747223 RepID=UPI0020B12A5E|nr:hypothetical protein [Acidisphaera sp. S103]
MSFVDRGAIDCDVHPSVPNLRSLFPYLEDHWIDSIIQRGMDDLETISYPAGAPITARTDKRRSTLSEACYGDRTRVDAIRSAAPSVHGCIVVVDPDTRPTFKATA